MIRSRVLIGLCLFLVLGFAVWRTTLLRHGAAPQPVKAFVYPKTGVAIESMTDPYLRGVVEQNGPIKILWGWYESHPVKKDDLVFYQYSNHRPGVVKIVRAVEGDHFSAVKDLSGRGWNLKVNGKLVTNISKEKKPSLYVFGVASVEPPLAHYEKERKGVLRPGEVIVLSSLSPGNEDSAAFGILTRADLLGKVEPVQGE